MKPRVEKGVPMPRRRKRANQNWPSFLAGLSSGDSFTIERKAQSAIYKAAANVGFAVTMKQIEKGFRVWIQK